MNQRFGKGAAALAAAICLTLTAAPAEARDLSLADAIAEALAANTGLRMTAQGEKTAEEELRVAKGQNGWSAATSASASTNKQKDESRTSGGDLGLTFSLPLYTGGKNLQQLYEAGSKARIDALRASVELSDAKQTLIKAQNSYEVDLATLRNLLNLDRTEPLNLTDDFVYDTFDIDLASCVDYATRNRKDILADQYTLQQKEEAIKVAEAGWKPTVNLSAGPTLSDTFEPSGRSGSSYNLKAGVSANWDVFDSGVTRAQVDKAKTERDTAQLQLQKTQEDADLAVRTAYYNMREAEHRLDSTQDAIGQAEQDAYIAREKYRAGEGIMLDVIDAQTALSKARLNHISAQYDYVRYKAQVIDEMGVGLTDAERAAAAKMEGISIAPQTPQSPQGTEQKITAPENAQAAEETKDTAGHAEKSADVDVSENTASNDDESASDVANELAGNDE